MHTRLHKYGHNFTNPSKTKILRQITEVSTQYQQPSQILMRHQWLDFFIYLFFHGWHSYNTVSQIISHMCEALSGSLIVWGLLWLLFNNQILVNVCYSMFKTKR